MLPLSGILHHYTAVVLGSSGLPFTSLEEVATSLLDYKCIDPIFHYDVQVSPPT